MGRTRMYRPNRGSRPLKCEICGARYDRESNLKRHLKEHVIVKSIEETKEDTT